MKNNSNLTHMLLSLFVANIIFLYQIWQDPDFLLITVLYCLDFAAMLSIGTVYLILRLRGWKVKDIPRISYAGAGLFVLVCLVFLLSLWFNHVILQGAILTAALIVGSRLTAISDWKFPKTRPSDKDAGIELMRYWHLTLGLFLPAVTIFAFLLLLSIFYVLAPVVFGMNLDELLNSKTISSPQFLSIIVLVKLFSEIYIAYDKRKYEKKLEDGTA